MLPSIPYFRTYFICLLYTSIRSNLDFMLSKKGEVQTIMFTSFNPGSGKTFISANLSVALALAGKRVILLEMDIRKGSAKSGDGTVPAGITTYLSGKVSDVRDIIRKSEWHEPLDVITSGPVPPNPAELLLGNRLDMLMAELRREYDFILIDLSLIHISKAKLIFLVREPVSRAISEYNMACKYAIVKNLCVREDPEREYFDYLRQPDKYPFEWFVKEEFRRMEETGSRLPSAFHYPDFIRHGLYSEQLERYLQYFSPEQILILESKSLKTDKRNTLSAIEDFLELPHHEWSEKDRCV